MTAAEYYTANYSTSFEYCLQQGVPDDGCCIMKIMTGDDSFDVSKKQQSVKVHLHY